MSEEAIGAPRAAEQGLRSVQTLMYQALSLEYGTLRQEIVSVTAARYQTLTVFTALAAAVVSFAPGTSGLPKPLAYGIGIALVLVGLATWIRAGRTVGNVSKQVAQLEADINAVLGMGQGERTELLTWETKHQERESWDRWTHGKGESPNENRLTLP